MILEKKRKQAEFDILARIQSEKARRGWNEYTLAKNSGIPQTTISSWYRNNLQPNVASIERICSAFNMTLSQFFSDPSATVLELSQEEVQLLSFWNALTETQRIALLNFIKTIPDSNNQVLQKNVPEAQNKKQRFPLLLIF